MNNNAEIMKQEIITPIISENGNLEYHTHYKKSLLVDENDYPLSNNYYCMLSLGNDHYAVCDLLMDTNYFNYNYYDIIGENFIEEINSKMKWGVIRVNRDKNGNIIPMDEVFVFPYVYDRISENNSNSATAYSNGKLTYLELDRESDGYGKQLLPCILTHAVPFDTQYEGFAECSINGKTGYLPRICKPRIYIEDSELLTETQVFYLDKYLKGKLGIKLGYDTIQSYFNLTGVKLDMQKVKSLKK